MSRGTVTNAYQSGRLDAFRRFKLSQTMGADSQMGSHGSGKLPYIKSVRKDPVPEMQRASAVDTAFNRSGYDNVSGFGTENYGGA